MHVGRSACGLAVSVIQNIIGLITYLFKMKGDCMDERGMVRKQRRMLLKQMLMDETSIAHRQD